MLIRARELEAIRAQRLDLAFRRWNRPRLRVGTRMRTKVGLVEVTAVDAVAVEAISDDDARRAGAGSRDEHAQLVRRLDRLDRASRHGAWTWATLAAIDRRPATRAAELADELGCETLVFKRDVRKLKELGLTESLGTGDRLSPRARVLFSGALDRTGRRLR